MQLQAEKERFDEMDLDYYAISADPPANHEEFKEAAGIDYTILSDPDLTIMSHTDMGDEEQALRGFSVLDENGEVLTSHENNHFAEQMEDTAARIQDALNENE